MVNLYKSYTAEGNASTFAPHEGTACLGHVILVHGICVRSFSMEYLAKNLRALGYNTYNYDYASSKADTQTHGQKVLEEIQRIQATIPPNEKVCIVSHSMGGILTRHAIQRAPLDVISRIHRIVMLAPPNRGSYWPIVIRWFLPNARKLNAAVLDLCDEEQSPLRQIRPIPSSIEVGIVVGHLDNKVMPNQTHLDEAREYVRIWYGHCAMCYVKRTVTLIHAFLQHGTFKNS